MLGDSLEGYSKRTLVLNKVVAPCALYLSNVFDLASLSIDYLEDCEEELTLNLARVFIRLLCNMGI